MPDRHRAPPQTPAWRRLPACGRSIPVRPLAVAGWDACRHNGHPRRLQAEGNPIDHRRMVIPFRVDAAGDYDIWARVLWPGTTANSYFIEVDDSETAQFGQDEVFGRWHWVKARGSYSLEPGQHRLVLRTRETNTRGDVVVIAPAQ